MPRQLNKLDAKFVENITKPGRYADGGGLYLQVTAGKGGATKSWLFRYMRGGTTSREMGLGGVSLSKRDGLVTLKMARDKALVVRQTLSAGEDPLGRRRAEKTAKRLETVKAMTFSQCGAEFLKDNEAAWKNPKHRSQWANTIATYAEPVFGQLPVAAVDTALVLKVLRPIWTIKTETATRVRGRIESILNWAKVHGYREGENPARWKGHLENVLANPSKVSKVKHHAAMPYADLPVFMAELRANPSISARALEWTILCASRTGETLGAEWSEVDLDDQTWIVPAERMKAGVEHRVPLSRRTVEILAGLPRSGRYLFPGSKAGRPLSNMSMLQLMRGMRAMGATVHGLRSTFKDWASEQTAHPNELTEMALAHTIESKVEAAYRRGDLFEKRKLLMSDWAAFCERFPQISRSVSVTGAHVSPAHDNPGVEGGRLDVVSNL